MKKRILCFGDSNTWGYNPVDGSRYDEHTRWPAVLQEKLGNDYCVIEEGQNGRTIACDDPWEGGNKNGTQYLLPMLESHMPLDYFIIMLGSNDLKTKFSLPAGDIAGGMLYMVERAISYFKSTGQKTKVVIVSPIQIGEGIGEGYFGNFFDAESAVERSKELARWYQLVAERLDCMFFDASKVAEAGKVDSLHLMPEGHRALAEAIYQVL